MSNSVSFHGKSSEGDLQIDDVPVVQRALVQNEVLIHPVIGKGSLQGGQYAQSADNDFDPERVVARMG